MALFRKKVTYLGVCLAGLIIVNNAMAAQNISAKNSSQKTAVEKPKSGVTYTIYKGDQVIKSNDPTHKVKPTLNGVQRTHEVPEFPAPSLDTSELSTFAKEHENALPMTWGIDSERTTWKGEATYAQLGNRDIATQLICTSIEGCRGEISAANVTNPKVYTSTTGNTTSWQGPSLGVRFLNKDNNVSSGFYFQNPATNDPIVDNIYVADGDSHFSELKPGNDDYSSISYDVKYGEPVAYFLFKSLPKEHVVIWDIDYVNYFDTTNADFQITSDSGADETLDAGTFWELAWTQYAGENTGYNQTETITHGVTKTESTSMGVQLGQKITFGGEVVKSETEVTLSKNWGYSTAINDQTTSSLQIDFPAEPERRILGIYKLMLGVHTKAPLLEKFLAPGNYKGFWGHIYSNPIHIELARSLPSSVINAENSTDAIAPGGEAIHGAVAVDY